MGAGAVAKHGRAVLGLTRRNDGQLVLGIVRADALGMAVLAPAPVRAALVMVGMAPAMGALVPSAANTSARGVGQRLLFPNTQSSGKQPHQRQCCHQAQRVTPCSAGDNFRDLVKAVGVHAWGPFRVRLASRRGSISSA
jgi:hypothetical protein